VVRRYIPLVLVLLACAAVAPAALAKSADVAATRAYIRANYALVRAARANLASAETGVKSLANQITAQCPLAAAGSPQDYDSEQLSLEVVGAMTISGYRLDDAAAAAFAHAVRSLRWSDRALTRIVRTYAAQLPALTTLALPDVCADVQAWAASGYRTLPASTVQFDASYEADDIQAEEVPLRLLTPYEDAVEASLVRRTRRLEGPLAQAEANAVADYTQILDGLELNQ
jgi:hypothetical protein